MLDSQGRIAIGKEILSRVNLKTKQEINFFLDYNERRLLILSAADPRRTDLYFVAKQTIDEKGRIFMPAQIRKAFKDATYLPVEKDGNMYILIFENEKKSE